MKNGDRSAFTVLDPNGSFWEPGLTKREYACIHLGIPETGDPELDEIIRKSERNRLAGLAMQGMLAAQTRTVFLEPKVIREIAVRQADNLLKELEKNNHET